ncbi:MAG: hypothetical protein IJS80_01840 [Lachnospiraceae bacterium]|nr:hypothetical protein [Lachnospiraceae bacterium]
MTQTVSLYDEAYIAGYNAALNEIKERNHRISNIREYKPEVSKQVKLSKLGYLLVQKAAGAALLAASVIGLAANEGDFAVALFTIPLSALIIITNKRLFK